jgi:hypothetical protein
MALANVFRWTGAGGGSDWNATAGTITNWFDVSANTNTIVPGGTNDSVLFNNGGNISVTGGARTAQITVTDNTFVTFSGASFAAGNLDPADNVDFPDDLVVDDDSKLTIASDASMSNDGSVSVIGLGAGATGNGTLVVAGGFSAQALILGDSPDGNGVVTVNNAQGFFVVAPGSIGTGNGQLTVASQGTGSLAITNTPAVFTTSAVVGDTQGAAGTISLDSSTWGGGDATIGAAGVGLVMIGAGASVALATIVLGSAQTGIGDLTVGASSFGADFLTVGGDGTGTATFGVGSTGTFAAVAVGAAVGAIATLTMDGSTWNTGSLTIGRGAAGHASAGGGEIVTFNDAELGANAGVSGELTIDAAVLNGGTLAVGLDGDGTLALESGSSGNVTSVFVGEDQGSSGTLTIDSSTWGADTLTVGVVGAGHVAVGNGAASNLGTILVGPNGGLAVTQAAGAVGTVTAQQVTLDFGTLDVSQGGEMLIGAAGGVGGAVAIGGSSALTGLGLLQGDVALAAGGVAQATGPAPGALKIDGNINGAGTLQPLMTMEVNGVIAAGVTIAFGASTAAQVGDLVLDIAWGDQGTIVAFGAGNTIDVQGSLYSSAVFTQGTSGEAGTLVLSGGTAAPLSLAVLGDYASDAFTVTPGTTDTIVTVVPCFAAGTRILTARGEVAVEALRVEDRLPVRGGAIRRVLWCGGTRDAAVRPVRVAAGAFGPGEPARDLYLSPDHAVLVDDVLVPVRRLLNGGSVARVARESVTYYHVQLPEHAAIFAEGLAAESYLDTGNRAQFAEAKVNVGG